MATQSKFRTFFSRKIASKLQTTNYKESFGTPPVCELGPGTVDIVLYLVRERIADLPRETISLRRASTMFYTPP